MANQNVSFSFKVVFSLLCILPLFHLSAAQRLLTANQTDKDALLAFKSRIIVDPEGATSSWTDSVDHCDWKGVTCGSRSGRVVALNLRSRSLIGSLPPHIANLSFLQVIDLENNTLRGRIPPEIGRLYNLKVLALKNNSFSGEIPANLSSCSDLRTLDVGRNKLTGKIPPALAHLSRLRVLSMHWNELTGRIPDFIGNLSSLEVISLARCALGGTIPESLGMLNHLTFLGLGGDNLSGAVPSSIFNLSSISVFSVSENNLTGYLPRDAPINLQWFQINDNFFTGTIPISFKNATKLEFIDFSYNNFSGPLLVNFAGMKNLTKLFVHKNILQGSLDFINSLVNCSNLLKLDIGINRFQGFLPLAISNLSTQLKLFDISNNKISGSIPPGISNLFGLTALVLRENRLTGPVPPDIGKLHNLQILDFSSNQLSGEIPSSIGNLSFMNELLLQRNKLQGTIPAHLGKCQSLILLNLSDNTLSGTIPKEVLTISSLSMTLSLSDNLLVGPIPQEIGNLESLLELGVSHNSLSGEIPTRLGNCRSLEILSMEENLFVGSIPASFSSLRALQQFDISKNNLSGKIPEFLGTTLSLKKLNLSSNNFNGEVPTSGIFKDAQALSLTDNVGLCGGISELNLPRCGMHERDLEIGILVACIVLGIIVLPLSLLCFLKRRKDYQSWKLSPNLALPQVSYAMLHKATDGFSPANLVGAGGFGSVYRGMLEGSSTPVAIKVFDLQHKRASKSFMAECDALKEIRHRNLVKLITACSSVDFQGNEFKALIYEFMSQGSLERWLEAGDSRIDDRKLGFVQRLNIAIEVASALNYLHRHCKTPVVHRDLKPSNILLDDDMTAHIADFGLAKFFIQFPNPNQRSTIGINGTVGYAAPEYGLGNEASPRGDVYSFGILLLQMMTGKKPTDPMFDGGINLHGFAKAALPDRVEEIVDPYLLRSGAEEDDQKETRNGGKTEEQLSVLSIGVACSMEIPQDRMDINDVVRELRYVASSMTGHVSISKDIVNKNIQE